MTCIEMDFFPANFMLQNPHENDHQPPSSLLPPCTSQDFHGVASFLGKRSMSFSAGGIHHDMSCHQDQEIGNNNNNNNGDDDLSDDGSQLTGEKKRRLNLEQVKTLEKNFELGNKLEPERKMQLARALGLQPRQIAIWFQNRRARWKTKQLEKDYDVLKRQFDAVKADNDALQAQNQKLQAEILALKNREPTESINLNKETEGSCSNSRSENSSDDNNNNNHHNMKLDIISRTPPTPPMDSPLPPHPTTTCSMALFPPPIRPNSSVAQQLFHHNSSSSSSRQQDHHQHLQFQKIIHDHGTIKEETFTNMFCGIDDQSGFWPWLEQHQFN